MSIKRILWVVPAIFFLCTAGRAQQAQGTQAQVTQQAQATQTQAPQAQGTMPEWELAGGFSYLRANLSGPGSSVSLNGGTASVSENLNNWFGGRFEFNAWQTTQSNVRVTAQSYTYGPVFSYRKVHGFTPFVDVGVGAIHASEGFYGISESASKFAMLGGGGFDFKLGKRAAIRIQGEELSTWFLSSRQDNLKVSGSLVIYLGHKSSSAW